jgi:Lipopolysaccharide-assembly, LptC-related
MPRFHNGRAGRVLLYLLAGGILSSGLAQQTKKHGKKKSETAASPSASASASAEGQVPLPIGHEAKGLVLPDIDADGHLRARFNAGTAKRVDANHMEFHDLNIITFTDDNQVDLQIKMADSLLDLNTHVLSSEQRTTIKSSDFEIAGDRAEFDTAERHGKLTGNVKMVLTNAQKYTEAQPK